VTLLAVKILHAADLHMDSPFDSLPPEKAMARRLEQRENLMLLSRIVRDEGVQLVLLAGDLFDSAASCADTGEALIAALAAMEVPVFIAPGNHDFLSKKSPYAYLSFPENVHVFRSPTIRGVELPSLHCRVWGAGMTGPESPPPLRGFFAPDSDYIELMVLHGDMTGGPYGPISEEDIAASGLDYLALGHVHTFSGIQTAGKTAYAYPGCPEGRGFDETGEKGVIVGTVEKRSCDLAFRSVCRRQYRTLTADLTGRADALEAIRETLSPLDISRDICRVTLTGEYAGRIDIPSLESALSDAAFHLTVRDLTRLPVDIWRAAGEDSLTGLFVSRMKEKYDAAPESEKRRYELAVRYGLAALENREEWRP